MFVFKGQNTAFTISPLLFLLLCFIVIINIIVTANKIIVFFASLSAVNFSAFAANLGIFLASLDKSWNWYTALCVKLSRKWEYEMDSNVYLSPHFFSPISMLFKILTVFHHLTKKHKENSAYIKCGTKNYQQGPETTKINDTFFQFLHQVCKSSPSSRSPLTSSSSSSPIISSRGASPHNEVAKL